MSRYATTPTTQTVNSKRYYETLIVPVTPASARDTYILIHGSERLDKIAQDFYNDATLWWVIATANGLGKGTILVPGGSRLRIPPIDDIQTLINTANNER